jgi:glycosyltransferase involved in cell wall biosynthesis
MRRNRKLRELKDKILSDRTISFQNRKRILKQKIKQRYEPISDKKPQIDVKSEIEPSKKFKFFSFSDYKPQKNYRIAHVIESLGLGGAQTQLFEISNAFKKYYKDNTDNTVVLLSKSNNGKSSFLDSYNVSYEHVHPNNAKEYFNNKFDIVLHYRISQSSCIKKYLSQKTKYVLTNTTINNLSKMGDFLNCDAYITVCQSLYNQTSFPSSVSKSKRFVVLNGVENDFVASIEPQTLLNGFITGRCQRLVPGKFKSDSLTWLATHAIKSIPDFYHYVIGTNKEAKMIAKKQDSIIYCGSIADRNKKLSFIKSFDMYYYETFRHEGASMAVLESLACGVPVLCSNYGGNKEIIKDGINGFICPDRGSFLKKMIYYYKNNKELELLKESTKLDFGNRLHIRHVCSKYMQIFDFVSK